MLDFFLEMIVQGTWELLCYGLGRLIFGNEEYESAGKRWIKQGSLDRYPSLSPKNAQALTISAQRQS